jgi:hypothetical protein
MITDFVPVPDWPGERERRQGLAVATSTATAFPSSSCS